jgi:hypothetical protein
MARAESTARTRLEIGRTLRKGWPMAISREQARSEHTAKMGHEQFSETIYGLVCAACHNYILIDHTNCQPGCREHESCRQAYA